SDPPRRRLRVRRFARVDPELLPDGEGPRGESEGLEGVALGNVGDELGPNATGFEVRLSLAGPIRIPKARDAIPPFFGEAERVVERQDSENRVVFGFARDREAGVLQPRHGS